ncbi:hypothetical protein [Dysgonomonas capnocytophagoides]|uniref:hypothetical protein n=1 Tax=Dysgonomonas capnocytophagoides TaxID=45254 RepID=UPI003342AC0D
MKKYILVALLFFTIGCAISFFIGRSTIDTKTKTEYVKGETIKDTVYIPAPYSEKKADKDNLIPVYKKDPEGKETTELDTTKSKDVTIHDWNLERKYANQVFDNENGKFLYDITVQNNKLSKFNYTFTPIQKVTTTIKEKIFQPYVSAGYSTLDIASVGGGFFYHNLGIEYQFQRDFKYNDTGHSLGLKYKF